MPDTQGDAELAPFAEGLRRVPKSGLHNPLKNPERCASLLLLCFVLCFAFFSAKAPPDCWDDGLARRHNSASPKRQTNNTQSPITNTNHHTTLNNSYLLYGEVCAKVAEEMRRPAVADFFARLVQRTSPKSDAQAAAEVTVTRRFFENFSGDQVRHGGFDLI